MHCAQYAHSLVELLSFAAPLGSGGPGGFSEPGMQDTAMGDCYRTFMYKLIPGLLLKKQGMGRHQGTRAFTQPRLGRRPVGAVTGGVRAWRQGPSTPKQINRLPYHSFRHMEGIAITITLGLQQRNRRCRRGPRPRRRGPSMRRTCRWFPGGLPEMVLVLCFCLSVGREDIVGVIYSKLLIHVICALPLC